MESHFRTTPRSREKPAPPLEIWPDAPLPTPEPVLVRPVELVANALLVFDETTPPTFSGPPDNRVIETRGCLGELVEIPDETVLRELRQLDVDSPEAVRDFVARFGMVGRHK
ncbi:MAG: hypothetical protein ABR592_02245 [Nitriliruptorales bacterium]